MIGEHPRETEKTLAFLREHPVQELVCGDRDGKGHDLPRWELRFIFHDLGLNRRIRGYGWTEDSEAWLGEFVGYFPRAMSKADQGNYDLERQREFARMISFEQHQ